MRQAFQKAFFLFCISIPSLAFPFFAQPSNPNLEYHLYKIRDPKTERAEFRGHMSKIGEHLALAIAKTLPVQEVSIETCLQASATHLLLEDSVVVITILRAGLPLFDGFLNILQNAEAGFLVYQRDHASLQPVFHASLLPSLRGKQVIIVDPMIATGGSIIAALHHIAARNPASIYVAGAIASQAGLEKIHREFPHVKLYVAAVDTNLNEKGYIVPGLGDAGDRSFGMKDGE